MAKIGYYNAVIADGGVPLVAAITVFLTGTDTKATIYTTAAGAVEKSNPFDTDALGRFAFFASQGTYDIQVSGTGITTYKVEGVMLGIDPTSELVMQTATFGAVYSNGESGNSKTIDWNNGQKQSITLTGAPCVFTFTPPTGGAGNFLLKVTQGTGGSKTATWPGTVKWPGGAAPTLSTTAGDIDFVSFFYDGTNYYGSSSLDFS